MARRNKNKNKNKNTSRDRTPTVIRQDISPITFSDSLVLGFAAFLVTMLIFLISYAIYARFT